MIAAAGAAVRASAAEVVTQVRFDGRSLREALTGPLQRLQDSRDRALCEALCFAACRHGIRYEALLRLLLRQPLARRYARVQSLLLIGLAQLDALGLPEHAALSASVEAVRLLHAPELAGLVNAVLRRFLREREALAETIADDEAAEFAHPLWLIERLRRAWPERWRAILLAANQEAPLWLRVNQRRVDFEHYREALIAAGLGVERDPDCPVALRLRERMAVAQLPGFAAGQVSIQDIAARHCVRALDLQPGMRVLDACAAPGGKTAALLEAGDALQLTALDCDARRLRRVQEGLDRLQLTATLRCADATRPPDWWDGQAFARILLDAPCSATGVIRRQPDIKWHRRDTDIEALARQQAALLEALWPLLAPGGRLLYATCSLLPEENAEQIDAFLARHPDATPVVLPEFLGAVSGAGRQRFPGQGEGDGFFYAALLRRD